MAESKPMKIIIVGAGISGLSTYLFLKKYCEPLIPLDLTIYESYKPGTNRSLANATFQEISSSSLIVGGGLGVQPNGMRIIQELGEELYAEVKQAGFLAKNFVFKSSRGWRLASSPGGDKRGTKGFPPGEEEFCLAVSRQGVRDSIFHAVGTENVVYKKVVKAKKAVPAEGKRASVVFEDGTEDEADLVIGADGVRSEVLRGIFQDEELVKPHYE
jgi:2-polyprenyl-6-methoxyphenol hydroxylase-like FAD-dependent oxidoreductase